jgi:hypothetical protein
LSARIAANTRWAIEPDRTAATEAARTAFNDRFLKLVDPEGKLPVAERAKRAGNARTAYYLGLAKKSAAARRRTP